jgi:hypothetical protein
MEASAFMRQAQVAGGSAVLLRRGDAERGALLLAVTCRGLHCACLQRQLQLSSGKYTWNRVGPPKNAESQEVSHFLAEQARFDPDSWQLELDIPSAERFIAETIRLG